MTLVVSPGHTSVLIHSEPFDVFNIQLCTLVASYKDNKSETVTEWITV